MILFHFSTSPFARRVRLVLSMKGLSAELRDPRAEPKWWPELHRSNPLRTVPTLVDGERILTDSLAIVSYLDAKAPSAPLWPAAESKAEAIELVRLADRAIDTLVDLGMRYHALHDHPAFAAVKTEMLGRAQGALDLLGRKVEARADAPALAGDAWSYGDIAVVTTVIWLEGLPARAATFAPAKQMVDLGWTVPAALSSWARSRRTREDVAAL